VGVKEVDDLVGGPVRAGRRHHPGEYDENEPEQGVEDRNAPKADPLINLARRPEIFVSKFG
jgi:hypothetical protein